MRATGMNKVGSDHVKPEKRRQIPSLNRILPGPITLDTQRESYVQYMQSFDGQDAALATQAFHSQLRKLSDHVLADQDLRQPLNPKLEVQPLGVKREDKVKHQLTIYQIYHLNIQYYSYTLVNLSPNSCLHILSMH